MNGYELHEINTTLCTMNIVAQGSKEEMEKLQDELSKKHKRFIYEVWGVLR